MRLVVILTLVGVMGCHAKDAETPKPEPAKASPAPSGLGSSEAVARAYAAVLNEGTLEAGLALFATEAMVAPLLTCTNGKNPLTEQVVAQRKQFAEHFAALQKAFKDSKSTVTYVGPGEKHSEKKGDVKEGCTAQMDIEAHEELLRFEPQSTMSLQIIKLSDGWYLINSPK